MALAAHRPPGLRTINSETNMAIGLLATLRDSAPACSSSPSDTAPSWDSSLASPPSSPSPPLASQTSPPKRGRGRVYAPPSSESSRARLEAIAPPAAAAGQAPYSRPERAAALARWREKKRLRTFKKTIRYDVRKRLADTRPRYKGRFSKPPRGEKYDDGTVAE